MKARERHHTATGAVFWLADHPGIAGTIFVVLVAVEAFILWAS